MLQIIVVALFLGLGITLVGKSAQVVLDFFAAFAEVMYKITGGDHGAGSLRSFRPDRAGSGILWAGGCPSAI